MNPELSILIVHTFEQRLIRQTLRNLRRAVVRVPYEVIIIDNNPGAGIVRMLQREFPEVRYVPMDRNRGFGGAMNAGFAQAKGEYILIFNPDIIVMPGAIEELVAYKKDHPEIGFVGPRLENADGTLQYSCQRFHELLIPVYRRTPLGKTARGKSAIRRFLMQDEPHDVTMDVDWIIGSTMLTTAEQFRELGGFDDAIFMYFEDTDLCRRSWERGWRVVYHPAAKMVHFHRRASADGSLWRQLFSPLTWRHMQSALYYFKKYRGKVNPRLSQAPRKNPTQA
jgi:GT2 family glycosyltransferase